MTILPAGKVNYRARIERAALLAERHACAREILSFYGAIANFQREFYEALPKLWGKKPVVPANGDLRSGLNLAVLLSETEQLDDLLRSIYHRHVVEGRMSPPTRESVFQYSRAIQNERYCALIDRVALGITPAPIEGG